MGRTTLLGLLTLAAVGAAGAPASPTASTDYGFDHGLIEGRRAHSELIRLLDELEALRRSYRWERDARHAQARRDDIRARITPALQALSDSQESLNKSLKLYAEEQGLQTLELMAAGNKEASPTLVSAMRAQTFSSQVSPFVRGVNDQLFREEGDWAVFEGQVRERRSLRRMIWILSLVLLAVLGALAYAGYAALRRRRRRRRDIITIRPE